MPLSPFVSSTRCCGRCGRHLLLLFWTWTTVLLLNGNTDLRPAGAVHGFLVVPASVATTARGRRGYSAATRPAAAELGRSKLHGSNNNNNNGDDDDEIAKLEAQLRKLKQDKNKKQQQQVNAASSLSPQQLERAMRTEMILSEQDLLSGGIVKNDNEKNGAASSSGGLTTIVGAVVALVVLLLFAQIPVGQDQLARYSPAAGPRNAAVLVDLGDLNPVSQQQQQQQK